MVLIRSKQKVKHQYTKPNSQKALGSLTSTVVDGGAFFSLSLCLSLSTATHIHLGTIFLKVLYCVSRFSVKGMLAGVLAFFWLSHTDIVSPGDQTKTKRPVSSEKLIPVYRAKLAHKYEKAASFFPAGWRLASVSPECKRVVD